MRRAIENRAISRKLATVETKKNNMKMLLKQVRDYRKKLERIKASCALLLEDMNPQSPFHTLVKRIEKDAEP